MMKLRTWIGLCILVLVVLAAVPNAKGQEWGASEFGDDFVGPPAPFSVPCPPGQVLKSFQWPVNAPSSIVFQCEEPDPPRPRDIFYDGFEAIELLPVVPPQPDPLWVGFYQVYAKIEGQPIQRNLEETREYSNIVPVLVKSEELMGALDLICPERKVILLGGYPNAFPIDVPLW